ncbi:MAG: hypothetical protein R3A45_11815, partial [Bdellovibrionota bacterium]
MKFISKLAYLTEKWGLLYFLSHMGPYRLGVFFAFFHRKSFLRQIKNNKNKNILCSERSVFKRDLEILKNSKEFNFISYNSFVYGHFVAFFIPKWMRTQILFSKYLENQTNIKVKEDIQSFAEGFIDYIQKNIRIDAVLFSGIDYYQDHGLHLALKDRNIPFISIYYENYTIPYAQKLATSTYKDYNLKFLGDAIGTFSQNSSNVFIEAEVLPADKIFITGAPRLDTWKDLAQSTTTRTKIVLFSFPGFDYIAGFNFIYILHTFAFLSRVYGSKREFV